MLGINSISNSNNSNQSNQNKSSIKTTNKKLLELSCYIKIERNGTEIKLKNFTHNSPCKILIYEIISENNPAVKNNSDLKDKFNVTSSYQISIKNMNNDEIFYFDLNSIVSIIDKLINEGKLTIVLQNLSERTIIFISKTSKSILENFVEKIKNLKIAKNQPTQLNLQKTNPNSNISNSNIPSNNSESSSNPIFNKKRKIKDLYNQVSKLDSNTHNNINNLHIKKFKKMPESSQSYLLIQNRINFLDLPFEIKNSIYEYLDKESLAKISLLCKEVKTSFDESKERLIFRNDTPSNMFNVLLKRFGNIKVLNMGKGKFLKNENFKYFDVSLKKVEEIDLFIIKNLNDESIRKFFSKTKSEKIRSIKLNFYLDSLRSALFYILEFFDYIYEIEISFDFKNRIKELFLNSLEKDPICVNPYIFRTVCELILKRKFLRKFSMFLFNTISLSDFLVNLSTFHNLEFLSFDFLIIEKLEDLNFLTTTTNLKSLTIREILVKTKTNADNFKFIPCDIVTIFGINSNTNQNLHNNIRNNNTNLYLHDSENPEDQLNNLSLEHENDYIEIFMKIFHKLSNLSILNLGNFVNKEILKIILLYCKDLEQLSISSNNITDECVKNAIDNLPILKFIDLRGCETIQGNCFLEINPWPKLLKRVKLSLTNYNFYKLIEYLRSLGIDAENYLIK